MSDDLVGKRALVTGGSKGIGRSIALALADAGAVVAVAARNPDELLTVTALIDDNGGRGLAVPCDVTDPEQVVALRSKLDGALGGIDILVNNAGAAGSHKFLDHPDELWHRMLAINLTGVYYVCKAFAMQMVDQGWGRIINIASTAAKVGGKYVVAYTAAKHGVLGLTRSLAVELGPDVTVNAICPGYVDTPMTDNTVANIMARTGMSFEQARAALEKNSPQRRLIDPDEIAAVALLLCRDSSRGISGQAINIDGGAVMY